MRKKYFWSLYLTDNNEINTIVHIVNPVLDGVKKGQFNEKEISKLYEIFSKEEKPVFSEDPWEVVEQLYNFKQLIINKLNG